MAKGFSRREFLKGVSGVAAVPFIVPSSVFGANAPSERITMGFIGTGKQSKHLQRSFMGAGGTQVVAGCDVDKMKLARSREMANSYYAKQKADGTWKGYKGYGDFRELLGRDDIDAVVIATPDHWHGLNTVAAAKAGKDIYCEKPMGHNITESLAMVKEVRRYDRVFQTGSMQRSDYRFRFACELVQNGYIGDIKHVVVNVGGPPRDCDLPAEATPDYLDWDRWLGPAPKRPYNAILSPNISWDGFPHWRSYKEYGGGGMTDWGAHHFDIAQWGLGMDGSGPVEVIPPDGKEIKALTYKYANGIIMTREGSYEGHGKVNGVLFVGSKGKVEVNRGYLKTSPDNLKDVKLKPSEIHLYESKNHYKDFLDAIKTRSKPICDVEIGCSSVNVCLIGNIAYELKRPLKWDPNRSRFAGDAEANRLCSRTMRSPWRI